MMKNLLYFKVEFKNKKNNYVETKSIRYIVKKKQEDSYRIDIFDSQFI